MIQTDSQIKEAYQNGDILIRPFDEKQIQPASYDFRVGKEAVATSSEKVINLKNDGFITLKPGDFAVLITYEEIKLSSQYVGRFGLRSSFARSGLIATTGPQIDPGYHGRLIIGVTNLTPQAITISYKAKFISIELHKLSQPVMNPYDGPYQGRMSLTEEEIRIVAEKNGVPLVKVLDSIEKINKEIHSQSTKIDSQTDTFNTKIDSQTASISIIKWAIGVGFSLLILVLGFIGFQMNYSNQQNIVKKELLNTKAKDILNTNSMNNKTILIK